MSCPTGVYCCLQQLKLNLRSYLFFTPRKEVWLARLLHVWIQFHGRTFRPEQGKPHLFVGRAWLIHDPPFQDDRSMLWHMVCRDSEWSSLKWVIQWLHVAWHFLTLACLADTQRTWKVSDWLGHAELPLTLSPLHVYKRQLYGNSSLDHVLYYFVFELYLFHRATYYSKITCMSKGTLTNYF